MTFKEISTMIKNIGLPYAYYQFPEGTAEAPPFICFYYSNDDDLKADNSNYQKIEHLNIELYSDEKDFVNESAVEAALAEAGLVWKRTETYIDTEHFYMVLYETDVVITSEVINNG